MLSFIMVKSMKKIYMIMSILLLLCSGLFIYKYFQKNTQTSDIENQNVPVPSENDDVKKGAKNANTFDEIMAYISENEEHMIILGQTGCSHCEHYKLVLEEASREYDFEYLYIDIKALDYVDQESLMNSNIIIPGKCRNDGKDAPVSAGFATPLTIFTKNKTSYDCIRGYVDKTTLISKLQELSFIN